jgi:hypothetical protein
MKMTTLISKAVILFICLISANVYAQGPFNHTKLSNNSNTIVTGIPNASGGYNYSNGIHSRKNSVGIKTYQDRSGKIVTGTPNSLGGYNYSNGVSSRKNPYGGQTYQYKGRVTTGIPNSSRGSNYSNGISSRSNVFGGYTYKAPNRK